MIQGAAAASNRAARAVVLAACAGFAGLTAWIFARSIVLTPYSDEIDLLGRYLDYLQHGDLAAFLLAPHNFHRLPVLLGLIGLDATTHAGGWILVGTGAASLAAAAAILAWNAASAAPRLRMEGAVLAAMLTLLPGNLLSGAIHINTPYVHGLAFGVAALTLAELAGDRASWPRRIATLTCSVAAGLSGAAGLALWPVLILGALRNREGLAWITALVVASGALVAFYLSGGGPHRSGIDLAGTAHYALSVLGLPWGRVAPGSSWLIGAGVLFAASAALLLKGHRGAPRSERLATRFILYALFVVGMVALGRAGLADANDAPLRYGTFLAPLHVGLLMLALPRLAAWRRGRPALALAALALVVQQAVMGLAAIRTTDVNRKLIADFRAGLRYPAMAPTVHPDLDHAAALFERLDAAGITRRPLPPPQTGEQR